MPDSCGIPTGPYTFCNTRPARVRDELDPAYAKYGSGIPTCDAHANVHVGIVDSRDPDTIPLCDFCSEPHPGWVYLSAGGELHGPVTGITRTVVTDTWAACDPCSAAIQKPTIGAALDGLWQQCQQTHLAAFVDFNASERIVMQAELRALWRIFLEGRVSGPPRRFIVTRAS